MALEPAAWTAPPPGPAAAPQESAPPEGAGAEEHARWRSLQLWDREEGTPGPAGLPSEPLTSGSASDAADVDGGAAEANRVRAEEASADAELLAAVDQALDARTVDGPDVVADAPSEEPHDEPLLEDALGVDLIVEGDEPVSTAEPEPELVSDPEAAVVPEPVAALPPSPLPPPPAPARSEPLVLAVGPALGSFRRVDAPETLGPRGPGGSIPDP
jgi:hypothetical protein